MGFIEGAAYTHGRVSRDGNDGNLVRLPADCAKALGPVRAVLGHKNVHQITQGYVDLDPVDHVEPDQLGRRVFREPDPGTQAAIGIKPARLDNPDLSQAIMVIEQRRPTHAREIDRARFVVENLDTFDFRAENGVFARDRHLNSAALEVKALEIDFKGTTYRLTFELP